MKSRPHVTTSFCETPWSVKLIKKCTYIAAGYVLDALIQKVVDSKLRRNHYE